MPETPAQTYFFTSSLELAHQLAADITNCLTNALRLNGRASLVVSGGSTPKPLFKILSEKKIDWQHVTITLADERWVDTSNPASNEHLVHSLLLQNNAARARFVGLKNHAVTAAKGAIVSHKALSSIPQPFDAVILGMGDDGHTASLFPQAAELNEALNMQTGQNCIALTPPEAPHERMTLTLPALLNSRKIILYITGQNKKEVLNKALADGPATEMPIRFILRQTQTPVHIFWAP